LRKATTNSLQDASYVIWRGCEGSVQMLHPRDRIIANFQFRIDGSAHCSVRRLPMECEDLMNRPPAVIRVLIWQTAQQRACKLAA